MRLHPLPELEVIRGYREMVKFVFSLTMIWVSAQHLVEVTHLIREVIGMGQRVKNLGLNRVAEVTAKAMNGHLHRA